MKISAVILLPAVMMFYSCRKTAVDNGQRSCTKDKTAAKAFVSDTSSVSSSSIYQLPGKWTDQNGRQRSLNELKGKVQVVAMIYTHCGYACPRMVDNMKAIEDQLPAAQKDKVGFVLITFDSERDNPRQLKAFATLKQLDQRWILLHGPAGQVRELSMLLQLKYQQLPDGNFSHSGTITLLDSEGVIAKQVEGLNPGTRSVVAFISQLTGRQSSSPDLGDKKITE